MVGLADEYREVQVGEILKQIENGEDVYLENCRIVGELNLSKINLETVPNPKYNELLGSGYSEGSLETLLINKNLKIVESNLTIYNSIFENSLDFSNLIFKKPLYLVGVNCYSKIRFVSSNFNNTTTFSETTFGNSTDFYYATFGDFADFRGASFGDYTRFQGTAFDNCADFYYAAFGGSTNFGCATFGDYAFFSEANFNSTSRFDWADFADTAYFSGTQFKKVSLTDIDFEKMRVSWDSLENHLVFDGPTYVKLIQNFRNLEQFEDADAAYYQYRKHCQAEKSWIPFSKGGSKWCDILMWFTCGYGVKPFRAFYLGGLIVLVFSFIYLGFPNTSWRNRENAESAQKTIIKTLLSLIPKIDWPNPGISRLSDNKDSAQKVTFWDSFYFSMVTFTTVGYGDWYPKDNFRKWVMFEGFLGWVTLGLFLVTLTNVMMRP